jgi:hypothetical protein
MHAFVQLREMLDSNKELARQFAQLETCLGHTLAEHDEAIGAILAAIRELMNPNVPKPRSTASPPIQAKSIGIKILS